MKNNNYNDTIIMVKDMNKKGMTFVEVVAVIGVILIIVIFLGPQILSLFNIKEESTMKVYEDKMVTNGNIYINDYCVRPLSNGYHTRCTENLGTYSYGEEYDVKYLCLSTMVFDKYISKIYYKEGLKCEGFIVFNKMHDHEIYNNGTAFLSCPGYMTPGIKNYKLETGEYLIEKCGGKIDLNINDNTEEDIDENKDNDKDKDKDKDKDNDKENPTPVTPSSSVCPNVTKNAVNSYAGYIIGDVDKDGELNNVDASLIQYESSGFDFVQKVLADVNRDGTVDTSDAEQIRNCLIGEDSIYNKYIPASNSKTICPKVSKTVKNSYANYLLGDVNKDGKLTDADVTKIQSYIKGKTNFSDRDKIIADVNRDGKVDIADALNIQNCLGGSRSAYDSYK